MFIYNYFDSGDGSFDSIRSFRYHTSDIESLALGEVADIALLSLRELSALRYLGDGVTHRVEEGKLKTEHFILHIKQVVVDRRQDAIGLYEATLGDGSALKLMQVAIGILVFDVG